ncbi:ATP-NAD kinase-like domain-containing protein [Fennellomyces sp. T-0311]|nr:ATP-NAD kinase-like domain-containing protein [Fennellomyces sp. T-0311]
MPSSLVFPSPLETDPAMLRSDAFIPAFKRPPLKKAPSGLIIEESQGDVSPITTDSMSTTDNSTAWTPPPARPVHHLRINTSVRFEDTDYESKPSIYLFIFVNPLSGDQKGNDLVHLPIQHFRLRRLPQVQVEIHNILDKDDREAGIARIKLVQSMVKSGQIPPIPQGHLAPAVSQRHIQVWSAGGDGTVMSVVEMLRGVDFDDIFFSCIALGTGNDFSQVLGWGRTIPHRDILGQGLHNLEELVTERLERSDAARLDLWEVEMTAHPSGYVKVAGPDRDDGHDVSEVRPPEYRNRHQSLTRKMSNYMSIGVQGYVGSGFEKHRAGNRLANMMVYTIESAKWVFWRKFPPVTSFIEKITQNGETVLQVPHPRQKQDDDDDDSLPHMTKHPIDFVIQNIPHIWGREVDLWGEAKSGLEVVRNRSGATDPATWSPQRANDGRMEIMVIQSMFSYLKKLANFRQHVSRIGQFGAPFEIVFRAPQDNKNKYSRFTTNRYERDNVIGIMADGEFIVMKDPKSLKFNRFAQIWALGRDDHINKGRLVLDEQASASSTLH